MHQSQARELTNQLAKLKGDRKDTFDSEIMKMLDKMYLLRDRLSEIEEPLETFDEKLFKELVSSIRINNRDEMTVTLIGGLAFTELI